MQLITDQEITKYHGAPMVLALGSFDGVHHGHQVIIAETIKQAKTMAALSGVFTFHPHPSRVLAPEKAIGLVTALEQKKKIFADLGVERFILKAFDQAFADTDFRDFVERYLLKYLKVKAVVVGEDFHFGRGSVGNAEKMQELGKEYGFRVTVFETIQIKGVEIRSTLVRKLIKSGEVDKLLKYLGRPFSLVGKVISGDGRGRGLGFPTANLALVADYVIPAYGVYAVNLLINGQKYPAIANIGTRPTFHESRFSIEIHILDFSDDLYGQVVEVELIKMLRPEKMFDSPDQLVAQIAKDTRYVRQILSD